MPHTPKFATEERQLGALDTATGRTYEVIGWIGTPKAALPILIPTHLCPDDDLTPHPSARDWSDWVDTLAYITR